MLLTSHNLGSPLSTRIEFGCSVYPIPIRHPVTISASLVDCRAAVVSYLLLTEAAEGLLVCYGFAPYFGHIYSEAEV